LIGVRPHPGSPRPSGGDEFDRLERAAGSGRLRFELAIAPLLGRFERIGDLEVGSRLSADLDALCFNPFNTGGGLEPVGMLNGWRARAYPRSQQAWGSTGGRDSLQDRAELELRALASGPTVPQLAGPVPDRRS
jgi:hypothetical protein